MALPPLNFNSLELPTALKDWLRQVRNSIDGQLALIPWASIDKTGSNLSELITRNHNDLQSIQGGSAGEYYHLTSAQATDLTDGNDSTSHYHASDRARANHTGTQTMSTISDLPTLAAGTYTPTITGVTNTDTATGTDAQYLRVGNVVTVSGKLTIDATAAGATQVDISFPVASSIANPEECAGTAHSDSVAEGGAISGNAPNNRASLNFIAADTTSNDWYYTFTYQVI